MAKPKKGVNPFAKSKDEVEAKTPDKKKASVKIDAMLEKAMPGISMPPKKGGGKMAKKTVPKGKKGGGKPC